MSLFRGFCSPYISICVCLSAALCLICLFLIIIYFRSKNIYDIFEFPYRSLSLPLSRIYSLIHHGIWCFRFCKCIFFPISEYQSYNMYDVDGWYWLPNAYDSRFDEFRGYGWERKNSQVYTDVCACLSQLANLTNKYDQNHCSHFVVSIPYENDGLLFCCNKMIKSK